MKRRLANAVLAAIVFAAMAASGCTRARTGLAQYFPLKPGMAWTFRFSGSTGATGELTTANQAPRKVFGFTAVPQQNMGGDKSYTEFYADDGVGIRHVAIDESEGLQSRLSDHSYVIKLPISVGTSWREIDRTFDGTVYDATTKIESLGDKITVPAGTFSGCVRIRSTGFASSMKGNARAPGRTSGPAARGRRRPQRRGLLLARPRRGSGQGDTSGEPGRGLDGSVDRLHAGVGASQAVVAPRAHRVFASDGRRATTRLPSASPAAPDRAHRLPPRAGGRG